MYFPPLAQAWLEQYHLEYIHADSDYPILLTQILIRYRTPYCSIALATMQSAYSLTAKTYDEESPLLAKEHHESQFWWYFKTITAACVFCLAGTIFLSWYEQWHPLTAAYVVTQIITTVGYGDFTVTETESKMFVALFSFFSLAFGAYAISIFCAFLNRKQSDTIRHYLRRMEGGTEEEAKKRYGAMNELIAALIMTVSFVVLGTVVFSLVENCTCGMDNDRPGCDDRNLATCKATGGYIKTPYDAFYMSIITLTTIGFGDFQPRTMLGRCIGIPWMLLGVFIIANAVTVLASYFFEREVSAQLIAKDATVSIHKDSFNKSDKDGNGSLDKAEFLAYTLLKYDLVSEALLDEIFKQHSKFDGGKDNRISYEQIAEKQSAMFERASSIRSEL